MAVGFAGGGEVGERLVDAAGGQVAVQEVAELGAGQPVGCLEERGVDVFGERVAGVGLERPGGGAGGVVLERERGLEVVGLDRGGAVQQRVDEREADGVRFGAGGELAGDPGLWLGEPAVGVMPERAGVVGEAELAGVAAGGDRERERAVEAGVGERVGVAAFGEQADAAAGDQEEAVEQPLASSTVVTW